MSEVEKWPKTWQRKGNPEKIFRVMPWYECEQPIMTEKDAVAMGLPDGTKFKIGVIIQIGWLLENKHGVWLGMGPKCIEYFDDITGDATVKKSDDRPPRPRKARKSPKPARKRQAR